MKPLERLSATRSTLHAIYRNSDARRRLRIVYARVMPLVVPLWSTDGAKAQKHIACVWSCPFVVPFRSRSVDSLVNAIDRTLAHGLPDKVSIGLGNHRRAAALPEKIRTFGGE